ncbi:ABC transporter ATP-binding protein [Paenibacillus antarcticus]|nr:ABC transporter ATP-binding protein [Paenibacillus antarcticus]
MIREEQMKLEYTGEPIISIRDLVLNYGNKTVLHWINLDVFKGQIIGYIGPNGAGKSTTVKVLLGLIADYKGEVKILGRDISDGDVEYKRKIGYVPEVADIYESLTAQEYLTFIGQLYGMEYAQADHKAYQLMTSFELDAMYRSRISSFSKGMKQKVLLISSLIHNPEILFLDEPLSGLDANSVMVVKELLACLAAQGKTIFYSSHIMDVVEKISNRIILLDNGKIIADGSFHELQQQSKEGSLEQVFSQLTGSHDHKDIAKRMVSIVQEV